MTDIVILEGARTPFGTFGGALKEVSPVDLAATACREALRRSRVAPAKIDHVVLGSVISGSGQYAYLARHTALSVGIPQEAPALLVSRVCGSGLQSLVSGAHALLAGDAEMVLAGGVESMSSAPYLLQGARWGLPLGNGTLEDSLWETLTDRHADLPMAITAENLAKQYGISRQEQDVFAYRSQMAAKQAQEAGWLAEEIIPVTVRGRRGKLTEVSSDEHPRPNITMADLERLIPRFLEGGTVTPGNASGINDGAVAMVLTTQEKARAHGLQPLARLVSWAAVGVDPAIMGIGPAPALRKAIARAGLSQDSIDRFEVNEAFAAQYIAVERELDLDRAKVNVNGGAIALGHPIGASGTRLVLTLAYELRRRRLRYGAAALCIGGGQGIAAVIENIDGGSG